MKREAGFSFLELLVTMLVLLVVRLPLWALGMEGALRFLAPLDLLPYGIDPTLYQRLSNLGNAWWC